MCTSSLFECQKVILSHLSHEQIVHDSTRRIAVLLVNDLTDTPLSSIGTTS
jgi:hypothetical protein